MAQASFMDRVFQGIGIAVVIVVLVAIFGSDEQTSQPQVIEDKALKIGQDQNYSFKFTLNRAANINLKIGTRNNQPVSFFLLPANNLTYAKAGLSFEYLPALSGKEVLRENRAAKIAAGDYAFFVKHGVKKGWFDSDMPAASVEILLTVD